MTKFYIIASLILIVLVGTISSTIAYKTDEVITIKVTEKERITKQNSSKYLIFTENEVLQNTDTIWYLKFNSSDIYSKLKIGETYNVRVYGYRIPFISMYRNIIEIN